MNNNIKIIIDPSIEMVKGFYSNGIHCGLKKVKELDLGIVFSEVQAKTYSLYTSNQVKGAPLIVCKEHLKDNRAQLLVVNSKIANTCTGNEGINNSIKTCQEAANIFRIRTEDVIPMSTGVIGVQLPVEKIKKGILDLNKIIKNKNENNFAKAIMTTDTYPKIKGVKAACDNLEFSIVGAAKGSGMIYPKMATMLAFIFTDINIKDNLLKGSFKNSIDGSFNSITVDGDTSTNDTAIIFANCQAQNKVISSKNSNEYKLFNEALQYVTVSLAKEIVRDGEGATKLIEINVRNAKSINDAKNACIAIANSNLVKTAFFGEDANWGRIICALGYSGACFDLDNVRLSIEGIDIFRKGKSANYKEDQLKRILKKNEIKIDLDLNQGNKNWRVWTSDLSYDYVKINASYRS